MEANITGLAAMVAYSVLLAVIPVALLGLFIAGRVLSSPAVQQSVIRDLQEIFPGSARTTLTSLLGEITDSTTKTGIFALVGCLWLGSSFWGALDTAFGRIYHCRSRTWLEQKRFGLGMVVVVLAFMVATVAVPAAQSILGAGESALPFDLQHVPQVVYAISVAVGLLVLFGCLVLIYARVPHRPVPWRGVWPGALVATVAIGASDYAFPVYLSNISTIARFGTTVVFVVITLGWFYALALILLIGAVINAQRLGVE